MSYIAISSTDKNIVTFYNAILNIPHPERLVLSVVTALAAVFVTMGVCITVTYCIVHMCIPQIRMLRIARIARKKQEEEVKQWYSGLKSTAPPLTYKLYTISE